MSRQRSVLITGASTGIGEACALDLAGRGWRVFAGVRREEDGRRLIQLGGSGIIPITLDVASAGDIAHAAGVVRETVGPQGLDGLVNNAGIVVAGPVEFLPISEWEKQFQVNVFGLLAVTSVFIPLLRAARGRIVMMGSTSGRLAAPFLGPYAASKFAVEAISDSLRGELHKWGIDVALIEPGAIATPIWQKTRSSGDDLAATFPPECNGLYGEALDRLRAHADRAPKLAIPASRVARAVAHALSARRPRTRYPVGLDARIQILAVTLLPDRLRDWLIRKVMWI